MSLLMRKKLSCLRPSLRLLDLSNSTLFVSSIHRLLTTTTNSISTTTTQAPHANPIFAVEYLIQSCGLSPDKALQASKYIQHLKSPDKPNAMLQFLRQTGLSEPEIRTAVLRNSHILCSNVEKTSRPNIKKLQELGFSTKDISATISRYPHLLSFNIVPKITFLMSALGSIENVSLLIIKRAPLLQSSLEKVLIPNISFHREQCNLSVRQIVWAIKGTSSLIQYKPETLKVYAKKAEELQVPMTSLKFVRALVVMCLLKPSGVDARKQHLESLGLSKEEVSKMISKDPLVLQLSNESLSRKMVFLMNEVGCDKNVVVQNPRLLMLSLEKRLVPRCLIWKLMVSKGLYSANKFFFFVCEF